MSGKNGVPYGATVPSTVLKALTEIQMVAADIASVTTCADNSTFYEPAAQARLTSNATYKRYIALKVSAQSDTAGTISIELYNVTQGTGGTPVTVVIAGGQENVEKTIAATTVTAQATALGDVFTIRVKHSVNGATVTLNSGGMMEADKLFNVASVSNASASYFLPCWLSSWKYLVLAGLSTASYTGQPNIIYTAPFASLYNIGSSSSTLNSSITVGLTTKLISQVSVMYFGINFTALEGQVLLGNAYGYSADDI